LRFVLTETKPLGVQLISKKKKTITFYEYAPDQTWQKYFKSYISHFGQSCSGDYNTTSKNCLNSGGSIVENGNITCTRRASTIRGKRGNMSFH